MQGWALRLCTGFWAVGKMDTTHQGWDVSHQDREIQALQQLRIQLVCYEGTNLGYPCRKFKNGVIFPVVAPKFQLFQKV